MKKLFLAVGLSAFLISGALYFLQSPHKTHAGQVAIYNPYRMFCAPHGNGWAMPLGHRDFSGFCTPPSIRVVPLNWWG